MNKTLNVVENLSYLNAYGIAENAENSAILEAIYNSNSAVDKNTLNGTISAEFGVEIPPHRLSEILNRLVAAQLLSKNTRGEYNLQPPIASDILASKTKFTELEKKVIDYWIFTNFNVDTMSDEEKNSIFSIAVEFVKTIFVQHGISSYNFLTNNYDAVTFNINDIANSLTHSIDVDLRTIVANALLKLLSQPFSADALDYYKEIINRVTAYRSIAVAPETATLIKEKLGKLKVYLDTSVLYRILNLQGEYRYNTVKTVIDELQNAGITLFITKKTLAELQTRIAYDSAIIAKHPVPCNLAELGYKYRTSENYVSTFWDARSKTGISAEDFNAKYSQAEMLLANLNIVMEPEPALPYSEFEAIIKTVFSKISLYDTEKNQNAAWDDAYNIAYIMQLQNKDGKTALETQFLFMTTDKGLFSMQKNDHDFKAKPPVVVLPSQLLQIISFIKPVNEYCKTFVDLFSSAANFRQNEYKNEDIQDLLGRINYFCGDNENIAIKVLSNKLFMEKFASALDDSEREEIVYSESTKLLNTELQTLQCKEKKAGETINELKKGIEGKDIYIGRIKSDYVKKKWKCWLVIKIASLIFSGLLFVLIVLSLFFPIVKEAVVHRAIGDENTFLQIFYHLLTLPLAGWFAFSCKMFSPNIKGKIQQEYENEFETKYNS